MRHLSPDVQQIILTAVCLVPAFFGRVAGVEPRLTYNGKSGPGAGKRVVLIAGDEEYRSEEALPQLGRILSQHHGFTCTVLFSLTNGVIDPNNQRNIPGLETLESADLMIIATRFRNLSDEQMKYVDAYVNSGRPIIGLRTATHAFRLDEASSYAHYSYNSSEWPGGFGRQVLGDTWISHHGRHKQEATRGVINERRKPHAILRGVEDIFGLSDVYRIENLPREAGVLVHGQVLQGMSPDDPPVEDSRNDPMMPLAWIKGFTGSSGRTSRVFCTTMGASVDLKSEGVRRLIVNAVYWGVGLENRIPAKSNVDIVGEFNPTMYGFRNEEGHWLKKGLKPADFRLCRRKAVNP